MRRVRLFVAFCFLTILGLFYPVTYAFTPKDLTIIEFKMTGSESAVIENTSGSTLDLSNYVLEYFNKSNNINFSVPTDSQQLPSFSLASGQSFLLSGDTAATCGAAGESNLGISLSDTNGYFEVVKVSQSAGSLTYTPQDSVSWTSSAASAGDGIDLHSVTGTSGSINSTNSVYYRLLSDGSWQRYAIDSTPCSLLASVSAASGTTYIQWATGSVAPATIVDASDQLSAFIPPTDLGLASPQITELLPNPAPPQSDDEDEFIELYNPNDAPFDLSGFKLQVGATTKHSYTIPASTLIPAKSFLAFFSVDTGLAMSNSGGQAALVDPLGTVITQSDIYGTAKDGRSWALADGKWYWTTTPTPGSANLINGSSVSSSKAKPGSATLSKTSSSSSGGPTFSSSSAPAPAPIHPWTLAGVGAAALLYAGYEYRTDLQNNVYRLRRYYEARRAARK